MHRQALNEAKKQNHVLMERVQALQNELSDSEVRRAELESQIRQAHTVSSYTCLVKCRKTHNLTSYLLKVPTLVILFCL